MANEVGTRTARQRAGDAAEQLVSDRLRGRGWSVLARNVHAGRSEIDIVAVDPGPPARLVAVEVRFRRCTEFGLAEETFDGRKRAKLRRGIARLLDAGTLPDGSRLPSLPMALDLAVVEPHDGHMRVRLYRNALEDRF